MIGTIAASDELTFIELVRDPWCILAPPDSDLPPGVPVPLARLHHAPLLAWAHRAPRRWRSSCASSKVAASRPTIVSRTDDNLTLQRLVGAGSGSR